MKLKHTEEVDQLKRYFKEKLTDMDILELINEGNKSVHAKSHTSLRKLSKDETKQLKSASVLLDKNNFDDLNEPSIDNQSLEDRLLKDQTTYANNRLS